jgi:hypothetical protein
MADAPGYDDCIEEEDTVAVSPRGVLTAESSLSVSLWKVDGNVAVVHQNHSSSPWEALVVVLQSSVEDDDNHAKVLS